MRIATTLALFLAGIPASASAQTRTGAIEGIVREEGSGRPVEGALVIVVESDRVARTNAAGHYVLTQVPAVAREPAPTLASPTVIVRVQRLGYFREMRELVVLEGDTAHLDFHVRQD